MPISVLTRLSPFPFYNFPGSSGARFRTVRTGQSATCRPSRLLFAQPSGATGVVRRRAVGGTTRSPDSLGEACRWPDRRGWGGLPDILDLAKEGILSRRKAAACLSKNSCVIRPSSLSIYMVPMRASIWSWRACSFLMVSARAACSVRSEFRTASPSQSRIACGIMSSCNRLANSPERDFLARVRLRAFPPVAGAVIVHIPALLQLANQQAAAMATVHQPGVREIVSHLARAILGASIQQLLDTLPTFARHQWFVHALVRWCRPNQSRPCTGAFSGSGGQHCFGACVHGAASSVRVHLAH